MQHSSREAGFALPMAVFVTAVLSIALAATYSVSIAERRVIQNTMAQVDAFGLAESGLELFLTNRGSLGFTDAPPAPYESTQVDLPGGFANVVLERVRPAMDTTPALYIIRSHGVQTTPTSSRTPVGERTVAQYAFWQVASMETRAAFVALTGMHKNGASGVISGEDNCGDSLDLAGVSVPMPPGYTQDGGGSPVPDGDPPIEDLGSYGQAIDSISIDWPGIVAGTAIIPDVTIPSDPWPSFADPNYWPVIRLEGDASLPGSGRGVLIVTGNLTMDGGLLWEGIILVGRHMIGNGNNRVHGAMLTGLDLMLTDNPDSLGAAIGKNSIANGNKRFRYDSCQIAEALLRFNGLRSIPNAWMDNWSMY